MENWGILILIEYHVTIKTGGTFEPFYTLVALFMPVYSLQTWAIIAVFISVFFCERHILKTQMGFFLTGGTKLAAVQFVGGGGLGGVPKACILLHSTG